MDETTRRAFLDAIHAAQSAAVDASIDATGTADELPVSMATAAMGIAEALIDGRLAPSPALQDMISILARAIPPRKPKHAAADYRSIHTA